MNKRADGGLTAIVIIIVVLIFLGWLINIGGKECKTDKDCKENHYCGSDFSCHKHPVIRETVTVQKSYTAPAVILGLALVLTAVILRIDQLKALIKKRESSKKEPVYPNNPIYYTEQTQSK